jgi:hypothetical protein
VGIENASCSQHLKYLEDPHVRKICLPQVTLKLNHETFNFQLFFFFFSTLLN